MNKLKIAYFGSPDFAAYFLEKLITDTSTNQLIEVKVVVTQLDQKVGRKQILTSTPVKIIALKHGLEIFEIKNLKLIENLKLKIKNFDLCLVYAFGDLIPKELLDLPKYGFWNIHPSLLPKYRGPSPIATALINGDKITGVTLIKMDEEIDHGPIIAQESLTIKNNDKRPDLEKKLTDLGFKMFNSVILNLVQDLKTRSRNKFGMTLKPQKHSLATYTKKLSKQDGFIEFEKLKKILQPTTYNLQPIYNLFRGLYPWPGIWTLVKPIQPRQLDEAKRLKITDLGFANGKSIIKKVQLEGKKEVDFETFNKSYKVF